MLPLPGQAHWPQTEALKEKHEAQRHAPRMQGHLSGPASPGLPVLPHQADEGVDLGRGDVLLQQLPVVVQQGGDGVLGQHVVADLLLHEAELLGDVLLQGRERRVSWGAAGGTVRWKQGEVAACPGAGGRPVLTDGTGQLPTTLPDQGCAPLGFTQPAADVTQQNVPCAQMAPSLCAWDKF